MKSKFAKLAFVAAFASLLGSASSFAANTFYSPGDLILYFQKQGGTQTVYANIGSAAAFRGAAAGASDGVNSLNFLDLNSTLTTAFGDWKTDTSLYAGLAGVWGTSGTATNNTLQDGDPNRTLYVSAARQVVGTLGVESSTPYTINTDTGMTTGSGSIFAQNNVFENMYDSQVVISPTADSQIDEKNLFLAPGVQGVAFQIFGGGVQQAGTAVSFGTFGDAGSVEFALDLYRILGKTDAPGQVEGVRREGSYEGTVTVGTNGLVSFVAVPEPSSLGLAGLAAGVLLLRRRRSV